MSNRKLSSADIDVLKAALERVEFSYLPADAIRSHEEPGAWRGPRRCPECFIEWTFQRTHRPTCRLKAALDVL